MLKIIYLTRNFPPMQGGMERLNFHIHEELCKLYEVFLVGPTGAEEFCVDPSHVQTCAPKPVWLFLITSFWHTLRLIVRHKPAMIFAGSGVAALPAVIAGRFGKVSVLTYLHGLDIIAPNPIYKGIFLPAIKQSQAWLVNSLNTRQLAIKAGIPADKIEILNPGTDLPDFSSYDGGTGFRKKIKAGDRPILLSVGRLTKRKGLVEFIEEALPKIVDIIPNVLLVVIGSEPLQSVAGPTGSLAKTLDLKIMQFSLKESIIFLGNVDDRTLSEAFIASQLHVFPVLELPGDVEGFGMVAVEAAAHGLPTIAFAVGGVPDSIEHETSGWLIQTGRYSEFVEIITSFLQNQKLSTVTSTQCRKHAEKFSWSLFAERLRSVCCKFIGHNVLEVK